MHGIKLQAIYITKQKADNQVKFAIFYTLHLQGELSTYPKILISQSSFLGQLLLQPEVFLHLPKVYLQSTKEF